MSSRVLGCSVSPRKSRAKSVWPSSSVTSIPCRASSIASTAPAGPAPTMQHVVWVVSTVFSRPRSDRESMKGQRRRHEQNCSNQCSFRGQQVPRSERDRRLEPTLGAREGRNLVARVEPQLAQYVGQVIGRGFFGDHQSRRNLAVGEPFHCERG